MSRRRRCPSPKGTPTPNRAAQRQRNVDRARHAQEHDPNIRKLYEAFAPPVGSHKKKRKAAAA